MDSIALISTVILPPLSVYLTVKGVSDDRKVIVTNVLLCSLLCLIFWIPGVVFASCITCFGETPILLPLTDEGDHSEEDNDNTLQLSLEENSVIELTIDDKLDNTFDSNKP